MPGRGSAETDTWTGNARLAFFPDSNITITSLVRGGGGQLRDLGGCTGLQTDDGKISQTTSRQRLTEETLLPGCCS